MSGIHLLITAAEFVYCATCNKGEGFFPSWSIWPSIIAHMNQVQAANLLHISTQRGSVLVISYFLISCSLGLSDCNTTNSRYFKQTLSRQWRGTEKDLLDLRASAFPQRDKRKKDVRKWRKCSSASHSGGRSPLCHSSCVWRDSWLPTITGVWNSLCPG